MAGWDGVELAPYLQELTGAGAPVFVDNDANVMALSERRGHLERHRDLLFVKASTGIGVGIVTGGRLLRGASGRPARSGTPRSPRPRACPAAAATPAASRRSRPAGRWCRRRGRGGHEITHVRDLVALAVEGDADARHLVRVAGRRIGEVLAVGGERAQPRGGRRRRRPRRRPTTRSWPGCASRVYSQASALATRELVIVPVTHGEQSGVVGCAALAIREVLDSAAVDRALATP